MDLSQSGNNPVTAETQDSCTVSPGSPVAVMVDEARLAEIVSRAVQNSRQSDAPAEMTNTVARASTLSAAPESHCSQTMPEPIRPTQVAPPPVQEWPGQTEAMEASLRTQPPTEAVHTPSERQAVFDWVDRFLLARASEQPPQAVADQPPLTPPALVPVLATIAVQPAPSSPVVIPSPSPAASPVLPAINAKGVMGKAKKLRGFSGKDEGWESYRTHLDIVCRGNQWTEAEVLWHFCSELSGAAIEYFGTLDVACQNDFQQVMAAMAQRFGTMVSTEAVRGKMDAMRQKSDQSLEDLSEEVRRLTYYVFADDERLRQFAASSKPSVRRR